MTEQDKPDRPEDSSEESSEDSRTAPLAAIEEAATGTAEQPDIDLGGVKFLRPLRRPAFVVLLVGALALCAPIGDFRRQIDQEWLFKANPVRGGDVCVAAKRSGSDRLFLSG